MLLTRLMKNVINAARDLGASYFQTLVKIIFPLSIPELFQALQWFLCHRFYIRYFNNFRQQNTAYRKCNRAVFSEDVQLECKSGLSLVLMIFIPIKHGCCK